MVGFSIYGPNGATVAKAVLGLGRFNKLIVNIIVFLRFGEEKHILMAARGPVFDGFRLAVRLMPDDIRAQIPPISLQGKSQSPRDAYQIFGFQSLGGRRPVAHGSGGILPVCVSPGAVAAGV